MVIGGALVFLSVFVILIGTKQSEAHVLYYDADYAPTTSEEVDDMSGGLEDDEPAAVEDARPSVTVTVGGNAVNQKPADDISTLRNAASKFDPTKTAQAMFEELKGEKL